MESEHLRDVVVVLERFVRPGATDMRKQMDGLVVLIEQQIEANVFEPSLFLFCNGRPGFQVAQGAGCLGPTGVSWQRNRP